MSYHATSHGGRKGRPDRTANSTSFVALQAISGLRTASPPTCPSLTETLGGDAGPGGSMPGTACHSTRAAP